MSSIYIPEEYKPPLNIFQMQQAIEFIKSNFQKNLSQSLNLIRVSAPLFVNANSGLNDNLNGFEQPVSFSIPDININAQVVHSLAKWKRLALKHYNFPVNMGIITDMNAIRKNETLDNLHSIYVDQWDWEKIITPEQRNITYLKETVRKIISTIYQTSQMLKNSFPQISTNIPNEIFFITSQELENKYPELTPKERENLICKEHKLVFLMQIGKTLNSGQKHDSRSPDYDDWELNGDILYWNEILSSAFEISSMGIRVDAKTLEKQLEISNCQERKSLPFHKMLLENKLPLTIGGGIGQSRLCMLLIGTAHIAEVQVSLWDKETYDTCRKYNISVL